MGQIEVTRRRGRRRKKLLDDLKDMRGYCELKEEAVDRTMWRNRFGRGFGPVVWQITDDDDDDDYIVITSGFTNHILQHYLIHGTIFGKENFVQKICVLILTTNFIENISHLQKKARYDHKCT